MKAFDSNISDAVQSDVELKPPAELLKMFMAHTPAAVAMCDTKMRYLAYSRPWAEDYGLGDDNLVGRCHYDLFPDLPEHWKDEHKRCLGGETIKKNRGTLSKGQWNDGLGSKAVVPLARRRRHYWRSYYVYRSHHQSTANGKGFKAKRRKISQPFRNCHGWSLPFPHG
jgi:PAS domain-containing protein